MLNTDVAVIGGGPAGAAVAARLSASGLKVTLIDQQRFPRDKVCGDFVGPAALVELGDLGLPDLPAYRDTNVITDAALFLNGKKLIVRSIPQIESLPAHGRVIPRLLLDEWILDSAIAAGAHLIEGHRVSRYMADRDSVEVTLTGPSGARQLKARLLIGADGSSSTIARQLRGFGTPRSDRIIAVRAYYEGIEGPADQADLYFTGDSFPGYYWLFPTSATTANVGLGMALETVPPPESHLRDLLLDLVARDAALYKRLRNATLVGKIAGWPLTTYNPGLPLTGHRVMLIGDAAGLINPLNGEGIQYALLSARWAAEVARSCVVKDDFSAAALARYEQTVEGKLRYDMALSRMIVQAICNRALNPVWLEALRIIVSRARLDPDYARITGGILAGLAPARDAVSAKIILGTLEQAAMSMGFSLVLNALGGPTRLTRAGIKTAASGFDMAWQTARHPIDSLKWSYELAMSLVELAGQAAKDALKPAERPSTAVRIRPA